MSQRSGAEAAKLKKFSDAGGSQIQWLPDAGKTQLLSLLGYITIITLLKFVKVSLSPGRIRLFFLLGVCAITLHFTIRLGVESFGYFSLGNQAKAKITQWEIVPVKNKFALRAAYDFEGQEKSWKGSFTLTPPYYLNEAAALKSLKEKAKLGWVAWYNPRCPDQSALENEFPYGMLLRTMICYGVVIYFFSLYKRVAPL